MSTIILWPQTIYDSEGSSPDNALGRPNGKTMGLDANEYVTVKDFQGGFHPNLLPLLNATKGGDVVTAEMLARTDVIAFEVNGEGAPGAGGWESSRWVFNDGITFPVAVDWDERTGTGADGAPIVYPAEVVANGSTDHSNYAAFFNIDWPAELEDVIVSYILFNLPSTIDISSPKFTITVSAWDDDRHGEGTPDPDAIGILACTTQDQHNERNSHMEGFHFSGVGGVIRNWKQEFAHLDLPPGKYMVFAKVQIAIGSASADPLGTAYQVTLEAGGIKDEMIGSLRYDSNDPGSRFESIALNVAVENDAPLRINLVVSATNADRLYAWEPRLSALQLDELHVIAGHQELGVSERQLSEAHRLAAIAVAGIRL